MCPLLPQVVELGEELAHRLVSLLPVLAHRLTDNGFELRWRMGRAVSQRRRIRVEHCRNCIDRGIAFEWRFPGYHFIENHAQAEHISPAIQQESTSLLRRHVTGRP